MRRLARIVALIGSKAPTRLPLLPTALRFAPVILLMLAAAGKVYCTVPRDSSNYTLDILHFVGLETVRSRLRIAAGVRVRVHQPNGVRGLVLGNRRRRVWNPDNLRLLRSLPLYPRDLLCSFGDT